MKNLVKNIVYLLFFVLLFLPLTKVRAQESSTKYATYIGGIGCPHCSVVSPFLHDKVNEGGFVMIEYEMYRNIANAAVLNDFADNYGTDLGIPLIVFDRENKSAGDTPTINNWDTMYNSAQEGVVVLPDGNSTTWEDLNLNDLKRYPNIYGINRIATRKSITTISQEQNRMIKDFIGIENIEEAIKGLEGKSVNPSRVSYPGGSLTFENAIEINGWLLQWDGPSVEGSSTDTTASEVTTSGSTISLGKTVGLALADSVNPCALSVLALVLLSIITYNPGSRKQVLFSGLAFVLAVIVMYLFYGFLIVKAFEFIQSIALVKLYIYKGLAVVAILLGLLELRDYFRYKPGGIGTEMPLFLRPKVQSLIARVTSPLGAFGLGLFVTLFLLPCTIGPYIILGGMVAESGFLTAMPYLLLYNLIFVLPMVIVVLLIFFGSKRVEDISDWREKNVRKLHLIAGIALLTIGVLMLFGII